MDYELGNLSKQVLLSQNGTQYSKVLTHQEVLKNYDKLFWNLAHKFAKGSEKFESEDLYQIARHASIKAFKTYDITYAPNGTPASFSTYLHMVISGELLNHVRKYGKVYNRECLSLNACVSNGDSEIKEEILNTIPDDSPEIETDLIMSETKDLLHDALLTLTPIEQMYIQEFCTNNCTKVDIAKKHGTNRTSVLRTLNKSFEKLKQYLITQGYVY